MNLRENSIFFHNQRLEKISFSLYFAEIILSADIRIVCNNKMKLIESENKLTEWTDIIENCDFNIAKILGKVITSSCFDETENLILYFDNSSILTIYAGDKTFESYIVHNKKDFQVVY